MKYKVIIVDDQYIARELFEYYIKSSDNYELENSLEILQEEVQIQRDVFSSYLNGTLSKDIGGNE